MLVKFLGDVARDFSIECQTRLKSVSPTDSFGSFIGRRWIGGSRGSTVTSDELIDEFIVGAL